MAEYIKTEDAMKAVTDFFTPVNTVSAVLTLNGLLKKLNRLTPADVAPKWISVEERLPEPDVDVLARCYYHERWQTFVCHLNKKLPRGWFTSVAGQWVQVTHWQPLPEPPKRVGENDA